MGNLEIYTNYGLTTATGTSGTTSPVSGTQETWTVTASTSFPAASSTVGTCFHIADPVLPSELIQVINVTGLTWTVIRGAEGTTPLAHSSGFTIKNVVSAGTLKALQVVIQPSGDNTGATDTANIQTALTAGYAVKLAPGNFYIGTALSSTTGLTVIGASNTTGGGRLEGSGPGLTYIYYLGTGVAIYSHGTATGNAVNQGNGCQLMHFTLDGTNVPGTATLSTGIDVGDQYDILIWGVAVQNFTATGTTSSTGSNPLGAVGVNWNNINTLTEKSKCWMTISNCTNGAQYLTTVGAGSTSHMYGDFNYHFDMQPHQNCIVLAHQGLLENGRLIARGNMWTDTNPANCAAIWLGVSGQTGHIQKMHMDMHIETDPGGSGVDMPRSIWFGTNADNQVLNAWGRMQFLDGWQNTNGTIGSFGFSGNIVGDTSLIAIQSGVQGWAAQQPPAIYQPSAPATSTSTTLTMMGLGKTYMPKSSGNVAVWLVYYPRSNTGLATVTVGARYATASGVSTTVAAGSNGGTISTIASWATPAAGQLAVASTAGFTTQGFLNVVTSGTTALIAYTGTSGGNLFTGCTFISGSGTVATGNAVTPATPANGNPVGGLRFGTPADPTIQCAVAGTSAGAAVFIDNLTLTPGLTYWFDGVYDTAAAGDPVAVNNISLLVMETS